MNGKETSIANRIGTWAAIIGLGAYVLNMGQWVGAAEEKHKDAETVEAEVDDIKDRLTKVEGAVENLDKNSKERTQAILDALKDLEKKVDEK